MGDEEWDDFQSHKDLSGKNENSLSDTFQVELTSQSEVNSSSFDFYENSSQFRDTVNKIFDPISFEQVPYKQSNSFKMISLLIDSTFKTNQETVLKLHLISSLPIVKFR
ncbi:hypothetical protein HZS_1558 [Henneguya salminicola]|nr:hypothetical protein HZS_1558 [Henneguya salminicola]